MGAERGDGPEKEERGCPGDSCVKRDCISERLLKAWKNWKKTMVVTAMVRAFSRDIPLVQGMR
jgi:hypothetical protein